MSGAVQAALKCSSSLLVWKNEGHGHIRQNDDWGNEKSCTLLLIEKKLIYNQWQAD